MDKNTTSINIAFKPKLICKSKVKQLALELSNEYRGGKFSRVGEDFYIACEGALKQFIISRVKSHPSIGKTLK